MQKGSSEVRSKSGGISQIYGQWTGAGAGAPVANTRADGGIVAKGLSIARTGVGLYTITLVDGSANFIMYPDISVVSPTQIWQCQVLTINASTGTITVKLAVGGVATDPANTEQIFVEVDAAYTAVP